MGQPSIPPPPANTTAAGKIIIITGGNSGLGLEAARQFLVLGARRVILAVRSPSRGQEAVVALRADAEVQRANPAAIVEVFELDLDDYESGLRFAHKVKAEVEELDVLLNNAGMFTMRFEKSKSGHERVMQVNCYTHLLITLELLPLLRSTAAARGAPTHLTFVGSLSQGMHDLAKYPITADTVLGHFDDQKVYRGFTRYSDSKLVVDAYVRRLAALLPPSEVVVNDLCPGIVTTNIDKRLPGWFKPFMFVFRTFKHRDIVEGSRTLVYASVVAGAETHGRFLRHNKLDPGVPYFENAVGKAFIDKVWAETVADVSKVDPALSTFA